MSDVSIQFSKLSKGSKRLILWLVALSAPDIAKNLDFDTLRAFPLDDGGMGSLRLVEGDDDRNERKFGSKAAELQFRDADGTPVSVSLHLDDAGRLFELDVFKADFSPLISIPDSLPKIPHD